VCPTRRLPPSQSVNISGDMKVCAYLMAFCTSLLDKRAKRIFGNERCPLTIYLPDAESLGLHDVPIGEPH